ncbi:hypothetical protein O181_042428 [Austropuccinia psidii MF-1]|uniref:Uncharacterized protein n=1 Tax=Austropuccinia psidii MF-1 TaxID=1389203 RepID=A0A9Q3DJD5_9BASI|nr:hypothetical protein [Austropuccinia psidii MF-1]
MNPVVTSKGKFPKAPTHHRNKPEDREGLFKTRIPEREILRHSTGWQSTEGNHAHSSIHFPIQQKPQTKGLEGYGSSSSTWKLLKDIFQWSMGQKGLKLASHWEELGASFQKISLKEIPFRDIMVITKGCNTTRQFRLLQERESRIRENQATIQAIEGSFQEEANIHNKGQDFFQPQEERFRPNDPEASGLGERSKEEAKVAVNTSRISSPTNRNIIPSQNQHNLVTPEFKLKSDALWLQMPLFVEKTQNQFEELQESHVRIETFTASMDKIFKTPQEGHPKLRNASGETNKRLNEVFEEQSHCKRDRDCLDQDLNKLFNFYQNMKPQSQGHVLDDLYPQEDIKPNSFLENKARSPSQYEDGDNMSYSEKEALNQLPEASTWCKFSDTGESDHMELIDYIDGLFIDVPRIPDYWISARLNTAFKVNDSIWYTEMKAMHGGRNWPWWNSQIIQKYSNGTSMWKKTMSFENEKYSVDRDPYEWCLRQSNILKAIGPQMNIQMRNQKLLTQIPGELDHAIKFRCKQSFTLDEISNTLQDVRKRRNIGESSQYKAVVSKSNNLSGWTSQINPKKDWQK